MAEGDPHATQQNLVSGIAAELRSAGFDDVTEVGHGGFGVVYRCTQPSLDRTVAVKVLTSDLDPDNFERFVREQRAMGKLSDHPHIVTIHEVGTTATGRPFIVMPYHAKDSLEALIRRHGPLDWSEGVGIGVKLAGALQAAHSGGILHRDVKPGNILLSDYGEPQLTDFGIARIAGGFQTTTGVITGSPAYTAPEVLEGATPTPQSDVYGLGATLFCAMTGHAAFERRSGEKVVAQFLRITSQPIPDLRGQGLPSDVATAIEHAMARNPSDRPFSAAELGEQLRDIQRSHGVFVDEMAHRVELGVESRKAPAAPSARRAHTSATPTPPTPATKYRPPVALKSLVARDRLADVLRAAGRRRLILINAPSGYGKSTLAAQWRELLMREGVAVAWLTVDDDDNNVVWFLAHLLESIRTIRPALAASLTQVLEEHGDDSARYVLTSLIDEIHQNDDRITLVVDDWNRVSDSQTITALGFLLEHGCHHLQLIVTSWSHAGLPLSKLRLRDELVEIDSEALRFGADETQALLNDVGGLALSGTDVAALTASTDGWAAGLRLATLLLRGGANAAALLGRLSGANDVIDEFLAENVVDTLEPEMADFMLATSITERICGGLASALSEQPRAPAMLEEVAHRGLFLQRIDNDPEWFRYHQLFAEFLRRRLERDDPERSPRLHRRAAAWFAEHGYLNEAVNHALAVDDPALAVDFLAQDETRLLEESKMTTFLEIAKKLPPHLLVSRPRLPLAIAWANMLLQRRALADAALNRFEAVLNTAELSDASRTELRVEADVLRGVADMFTDRTDRIGSLVSEAFARPDTFHPRVPGVAGNVAAFAAIYRFEFDDARRLLQWAAPYQDLMGPFASVYAHSFAGIAAKHQLDIPTARREFREAFEIGSRVGSRSHAARLAGALLGELLYEVGDFDAAAHLLELSYGLGPEGGGVDYLAARYAGSAKIKAAQGDLGAAAERLDAGMEAAEQLQLPRLAAAINNARIRLGIGVPPAVASRLRSVRAIPRDDGIATITAELDEDSAVHLLLASDSDAEHEQACSRATELLAGIDATRRPLAVLQAQLLLAQTLTRTGNSADAKSLAVARRCQEVGLPRLAVDAGLVSSVPQ
jgi:serine/threonine-protein kinase PknK